MSTDAESSPFHQSMLDDLKQALQEDGELSTEARNSAMHEFDQALQQAAANPKPISDVLADWNGTVADLRQRIEAMQQNEEITATDAGDMLRQFDEVTRTLESIQDDGAVQDGTPPVSAGSELPSGMPADLAMKLAGQ